MQLSSARAVGRDIFFIGPACERGATLEFVRKTFVGNAALFASRLGRGCGKGTALQAGTPRHTWRPGYPPQYL